MQWLTVALLAFMLQMVLISGPGRSLGKGGGHMPMSHVLFDCAVVLHTVRYFCRELSEKRGDRGSMSSALRVMNWLPGAKTSVAQLSPGD